MEYSGGQRDPISERVRAVLARVEQEEARIRSASLDRAEEVPGEPRVEEVPGERRVEEVPGERDAVAEHLIDSRLARLRELRAELSERGADAERMLRAVAEELSRSAEALLLEAASERGGPRSPGREVSEPE